MAWKSFTEAGMSPEVFSFSNNFPFPLYKGEVSQGHQSELQCKQDHAEAREFFFPVSLSGEY